MALKMNLALRHNVINGMLNSFEQMSVYSGTAPADADAGTSGSLLVSINVDRYNGVNWPNATNGTAVLGGTAIGTAVGSGTAGYVRIADDDRVWCMQSDDIGENLENLIRLDSVAISSGGTVSLLACTILYPEE